MNWYSRVSSTSPLRVQVDIDLSGIRGVFRRAGPVLPDSSRA